MSSVFADSGDVVVLEVVELLLEEGQAAEAGVQLGVPVMRQFSVSGSIDDATVRVRIRVFLVTAGTVSSVELLRK